MGNNKMNLKRALEIIEAYVKWSSEEFDDEYDEDDGLTTDGDSLNEYIVSDWKIKYYKPDQPDFAQKYASILSTFKCEASYGGEGSGDEYWYVFKVTDSETGETALVRYQGYYTSWEGASWYDTEPELVESYIEPVTKYRALDQK